MYNSFFFFGEFYLFAAATSCSRRKVHFIFFNYVFHVKYVHVIFFVITYHMYNSFSSTSPLRLRRAAAPHPCAYCLLRIPQYIFQPISFGMQIECLKFEVEIWSCAGFFSGTVSKETCATSTLNFDFHHSMRNPSEISCMSTLYIFDNFYLSAATTSFSRTTSLRI